MMHEIIHSEDSVNSAIMELLNNGFSYGKPSFVRSKNKFIYRLVAEGRANYGEALLSSKLKRTDVCFYSSIVAASATALYAADAVRYALNSNIALAVIYGALSFLLAYGTLYSFRSWGFKNSIFQLAKKIGDPVKAFRITTDKIPQTLAQILFPSAFYAPEIKQALNEKIDGKPLPIS